MNLFGVIFYATVLGAPNDICIVAQQDLKICGEPNIDEQACLALGCCFDNTAEIACFGPINNVLVPPITNPINPNPINQCVVDQQDLQNCGEPGITKDACEELNCCFDPNAEFTCYKQKINPNDECAIPTQEILDCGVPNITQDECITKGCCFNPNALFTCFQKPVPKIPVNTITDPKGEPVNLDNNGVPQDIPDMVNEDELFPQVAADPNQIPQTPTVTNNDLYPCPSIALFILWLLSL